MDDRHRSVGNSLSDMVVPILVDSLDRDECRIGNALCAVEGDIPDRWIGIS
jgi:hypothetical protein